MPCNLLPSFLPCLLSLTLYSLITTSIIPRTFPSTYHNVNGLCLRLSLTWTVLNLRSPGDRRHARTRLRRTGYRPVPSFPFPSSAPGASWTEQLYIKAHMDGLRRILACLSLSSNECLYSVYPLDLNTCKAYRSLNDNAEDRWI
jgi:hypothetical protein